MLFNKDVIIIIIMVRGCNTGWACNVPQNIDPNYILFTILYMVVSRAILRLSSNECQFKSSRAGLFEAGSR